MISIKDYKLTEDWKLSTGGRTVFAEKAGKKFFLKEYGAPICPSHTKVTEGAISEKSFQKSKKLYDSFFSYRKTINEKLNSIASSGGNIICPLDWGTIDSHFVEVTEFVSGLMAKDKVARLKDEEKIMILLTAVGALKSVHKLDIIHGDIKFANIAVTKNSMGNHVGKLIDFDSSFLGEVKPMSVGGDTVYMAPEMIECHMSEMEPSVIELLTEKSDIFPLGIVFHEYMTGELPKITSIPTELEWKKTIDNIYIGEFVLYGGTPAISPKIKNAQLAGLIKKMLFLDPTKRPSADEVLTELKKIREGGAGATTSSGGTGVSSSTSGRGSTVSTGSSSSSSALIRTFCTPYPEDKIEFIKSKIEAMKYCGSKQSTVAGKKVYEFYRENGMKFIYTREKAITSGLAKAIGSGATVGSRASSSTSTVVHSFCTPYPEDKIEFIKSKIEAMKYCGSKQSTVAGKKVYEFYRENGMKFIYTKEKALMAGLAKNK